MELLLHQVMAGLATGGIYACMALAVVMIFQAIDHLNFAQGEMAMFSTFIAWQVMQWGQPYWVAFVAAVVLSFIGGVLIERVLFRPIHNAPGLSSLAAFIAPFSLLNRAGGRHERRGARLPWAPVSVLPRPPSRPRDARCRRQPGIGPPCRYPGRLDDSARLGHGRLDRGRRWHANRAGRLSRTQHDARRSALWLRRRRARWADEPGRRRPWRVRGRRHRECCRHLYSLCRARAEIDDRPHLDRRRFDGAAQRSVRTQRCEPGMSPPADDIATKESVPFVAAAGAAAPAAALPGAATG